MSVIHKSRQIIAGIIYYVIALLALTPLNVISIKKLEYGIAPDKIGILYNFSDYLAIFVLLLSIFLLIQKYRSALNTNEKRQIKLVLYGVGFVGIVNIISGFIVLRVLKTDNISLLFGNVAYVGFSAIVAYTIIKHKLFDVRLLVVRALGYLLAISLIASVYSLVVLIIFTQLFKEDSVSTGQQVLNTIIAILFGFSLPPLKKFFDKLTNKLFYRDAYNAQELLDRLNKILVGNIELDSILKQTSDIIANTLKAEYAAFLIRETKGTTRRASFSKIVQLNSEDILALPSKMKGKTEVYVADEIENPEDKHKKIMSENNIAVAAKLAGEGTGPSMGYLLLGFKQSGNPYNKQDLQVLDIIANELVIAIQNALRFEEIETFNVTLQQKVNDATKQLRQTNEKLKALDETKDEFISMASHQLRTPLTAVKGYVSMVVEGDAGKLNKQQKELLDQAFASSQRMVYLIADLLNVSRLKSGKFVIENKPTQLADVVESEMEQLQDMARSKEQTLTYAKPEKFPALMLDETKIRQVIMNFADNALHYTPNGGHIQINLEDKGETIEFTVVDDGLGVPKSEQHHLFTKFYRAGNAKKARPDGTGLGLFMAKKVIIAQGGAIIFQSEEGKGSTFGFTFPKAKMLAPDQAKSSSAKAATAATPTSTDTLDASAPKSAEDSKPAASATDSAKTSTPTDKKSGKAEAKK